MRGDAFDTSKYGRNPFLKWPGGKRWLAPVLAHVFKDKFTGKYYEPFLGSGSVFSGEFVFEDVCQYRGQPTFSSRPFEERITPVFGSVKSITPHESSRTLVYG